MRVKGRDATVLKWSTMRQRALKTYFQVCFYYVRDTKLIMTIFIGMNSDNVRDAAATFILNTKEKHKIPQSVICSNIEDVTSLFQLCLSNINNLVKPHSMRIMWMKNFRT